MAGKVELDYITVDVFTQEPYLGNPLAIVKLPRSKTITQEQKQKVAREFNYSETVILHEAEGVGGQDPRWNIDIFLTNAEIPFAGHPTVGTACFLGSEHAAGAAHGAGGLWRGTLVTKAGEVPFTYEPGSGKAGIEVPHDVHVHPATLTVEDARDCCGMPQIVCENIVNKPPLVSLVKGLTFVLVQLRSREVLAALAPGLRPLPTDGKVTKEWHPDSAFLGFLFFVNEGESEDDDGTTTTTTRLRARMIAGSLEDPATGAANSALAAYLALQDAAAATDQDSAGGEVVKKTKRYETTQGVEMGRESLIGMEVTTNAARARVERLVLSGTSAPVMAGVLKI